MTTWAVYGTPYHYKGIVEEAVTKTTEKYPVYGKCKKKR